MSLPGRYNPEVMFIVWIIDKNYSFCCFANIVISIKYLRTNTQSVFVKIKVTQKRGVGTNIIVVTEYECFPVFTALQTVISIRYFRTNTQYVFVQIKVTQKRGDDTIIIYKLFKQSRTNVFMFVYLFWTLNGFEINTRRLL